MTIYNLFWGPTCHPPPVLGPNLSSPTCFGAQLVIPHLFWGPTSHPPPVLGPNFSFPTYSGYNFSPVFWGHWSPGVGVIHLSLTCFGGPSPICFGGNFSSQILLRLSTVLFCGPSLITFFLGGGDYLLPVLGCLPPICFREPLTMTMLGQPSHLVHIHYNPLGNLSSYLNSSIQPR